jgi:hypothetical protein
MRFLKQVRDSDFGIVWQKGGMGRDNRAQMDLGSGLQPGFHDFARSYRLRSSHRQSGVLLLRRLHLLGEPRRKPWRVGSCLSYEIGLTWMGRVRRHPLWGYQHYVVGTDQFFFPFPCPVC